MSIHDYVIGEGDLDKLWERHQRPGDGQSKCIWCGESWPCAIIRWLSDKRDRYYDGR